MKSLYYLIFFAGFLTQTSVAGTFAVNTTTDAIDINVGDGVCEATVAMGDCTVRAAIMETNFLPGAHIVNIPAGTFTLTIDGDGSTQEGDLEIVGAELTINGAGANATILDAGGIDRFFRTTGSHVEINDLTIRNGYTDEADNQGGAISVSAVLSDPNILTLNRVHLLDNTARQGGGISAGSGSVTTIRESLIEGNENHFLGGGNIRGSGINCSACMMTVASTTLTGNGLINGIKVIWAEQEGLIEILNSTISDNRAGISISRANVIMKFSTVSNNGNENLRLFSNDGSHIFDVSNSIIQVDLDVGSNCDASNPPDSLGFNIVNDESCSFSSTGDLENTQVSLPAPANNGGLTPTQLPPDDSIALDHVPLAECTDLDGAALTEDQRGFPRPLDVQCDAGAVETDVINPDIFLRNGFDE